MIEETIVHCPSCGEPFALEIDTSAGSGTTLRVRFPQDQTTAA